MSIIIIIIIIIVAILESVHRHKESRLDYTTLLHAYNKLHYHDYVPHVYRLKFTFPCMYHGVIIIILLLFRMRGWEMIMEHKISINM